MLVEGNAIPCGRTGSHASSSRYSSVCAPLSGSGGRAARIHTRRAMVAAPTWTARSPNGDSRSSATGRAWGPPSRTWRPGLLRPLGPCGPSLELVLASSGPWGFDLRSCTTSSSHGRTDKSHEGSLAAGDRGADPGGDGSSRAPLRDTGRCCLRARPPWLQSGQSDGARRTEGGAEPDRSAGGVVVVNGDAETRRRPTRALGSEAFAGGQRHPARSCQSV
jgi:hypothetical protein